MSEIPFLAKALPRALDLIESIAGSNNLDVIETAADSRMMCLSAAVPICAISYFSPFPFATLAISSIGLWFATRSNYLEGKKTLIESKLEQIVADSEGKPRRALIIQSAKDTYALSMRTHVEKVRELAKTHSIVRIVVQKEKEKEFLKLLPPGQFDIVWLRAHGHPNRIEIGTGFELTKTSPPKVFQTLASKVAKRGKLILECCNTARGTGTIADLIASYCWNGTVYAPIARISGILGLEFDKWGYPQFNDGFLFKGRNVTRVIEGPERSRLFFYSRY